MQQQQQPARRRSPGAGGGWAAPATVDEASMERSKSFINALQELKNMRPQLYSASEYCEKSYLHAQQKQMFALHIFDSAELYLKFPVSRKPKTLSNLNHFRPSRSPSKV